MTILRRHDGCIDCFAEMFQRSNELKSELNQAATVGRRQRSERMIKEPLAAALLVGIGMIDLNLLRDDGDAHKLF